MDRSNNFILKIIEKARINKLEGYWELIATAAGDDKAIIKTLSCLDINELDKGAMSSVTSAPSIVEKRLQALSVSRIDLLNQLWNDLKNKNGEDPFGNPFLYMAKQTLKKIIFPQKTNDILEPWKWNDNLNIKPNKAVLLSLRPLLDKELTTKDFFNAIQNGGVILRALRFQNVILDNIDFSYWMKNISSNDPWILAIIIELSRKANIPIEKWIESYLPFYENVLDPLDVIPSIYTLISSEWCVQ
jgi:hypothetical protein